MFRVKSFHISHVVRPFLWYHLLTLSQTTILESSKLKGFADNNSKFDENGREFSKQGENTVEKGEIAHYKQFLLFPQCFQKTCTCRHIKTRDCLGKG